LPRGKVVLEIDGTTDIFKAKEVLGDHLCIMGDVPAQLLKLGTPDDVRAYVKKLIDVVGKGGGFILSSGCDVPVDAKPENVKAVIEVGMTYYPHNN
jgi:uroporphyrinogen-III decarboxylase